MCKNERLMIVLMWVVLMGWLVPAMNAQGLVADGLVFWLDASKPADIELSGDTVSRWNDRSGNNYYADQTDPTLQPIYINGALNGKGIVDFGDSVYGSLDQPWMQFRDAAGGALNISNIRTVFWVAGMDEGSNGFLLGDDNNYHFHRGQQRQIWDGANSWAHANIRNGTTYLNGVQVDGTATELPTDYSIISLVTAGNVEASTLTLDRTYRTGGIKLGELLIYDRPLSDEERAGVEAYLYTKWMVPGTASDPQPPSGATDVRRDVGLAWTPGEFAVTHDVYFGTVLDDVNTAGRSNPLDVLLSQGQSEAAYAPDAILAFGETYYWRIDEVNGAPDNTIYKGEVWSFTVEPFAYAVENIIATSNGISDAGVGPERTVDGSGLNEADEHSVDASDMWLAVPGAEPLQLQYEFDAVYKLHEMLVWNYNVQFELMLGFGLKDVTVEYTDNGTDWMVLGDVVLAQGTARDDYAANTAVALNGVAASGLRLTVNSGYGPMGQFGLSEVRILAIPAQAREPQPADGATDVAADTALSWRAGREAVVHDVLLGTDAEALSVVDSVAQATYVPGDLEFGMTYYWQINEVNEADAISVWAGDVWSFATQEFAVIDDMESYNDDENRIYDSWLDGFANDTGSTVGYFEAPFAETSIVNSGGQSMPLEYDNSAAPFYSEAELDLGSMNLTTNGADSLQLFVSGQAPAFFEAADDSVLMNAIGTDIWGNADEFRYVYKTLTGDGSMIALVEDLDSAPSTWAKAGVMVRQDTSVGSRHSFMCMTGGDGNGASWQGRLTDNASSVNNDATSAVAPPYWVRIDRAGDSLTGSVSADGETWTQIGDARSIAMNDPVLIGLALTSHNAAQATSATFSNISTTGSVNGNWQVAEIGLTQPEGNIPEPLYVAVEDTSGDVAVVTHPDDGATARSGWTEWIIPYSDLAGVNLSRAAMLYVGVGDRDNPTAGGTGMIFVDDIGYGRPATVE